MAMVEPNNTMYCYHFDATGHTVALTDTTKAIVNAYAYTPFGTIANQQEAVPQPFKFVGQCGVMTEDNGWYYMRVRFYDPATHRFISEDPLSSEIANKVSDGEETIINIVQLTKFNWDELYIFKPYCTSDIIHETTKKQFLESNEIPMGVPEGGTFLVFMKKGEIVKYFIHPRVYGDFSDFKGDYLLVTPTTANFIVMHEGYSLHCKWYKLCHIESSVDSLDHQHGIEP